MAGWLPWKLNPDLQTQNPTDFMILLPERTFFFFFENHSLTSFSCRINTICPWKYSNNIQISLGQETIKDNLVLPS